MCQDRDDIGYVQITVVIGICGILATEWYSKPEASNDGLCIGDVDAGIQVGISPDEVIDPGDGRIDQILNRCLINK